MTAKAHRLGGHGPALAFALVLAIAIFVHLAHVYSRQPPRHAFAFPQITSESDYFERLSNFKVHTRLSTLNDLGPAAFTCDNDKRDHCVFENICTATPLGKVWFTRNVMPDYASQPFRLEHRGKEYFRLEPVVEANLTRTVHVIDEHGRCFSVRFPLLIS